MILHPGIVALLGSSAIVNMMMLYSAFAGLRIIRYWDSKSSSALQLSLERRTYLLSSILSFVLGVNLLGLFLFIYTADDLHTQFVGAMCATGTLNANPIGWWVLGMKLVLFLFSAVWIFLNYLDQRTEDVPFVKKRYALLLVMTPLFVTEALLQLRFFLGLRPNIITSCCGALFSENSGGIASSIAGAPVRPMEYLFFTVVFLYLIVALCFIVFQMDFLKYLLGGLALVFLPVSIASIISFISPYFYELPTHHCPFDLLQGLYGYVGYPLYISLLLGTLFGLFPSLSEFFKGRSELPLRRWQRLWTTAGGISVMVFTAISVYPMLFSSFVLEG